MFKIFKPKIKLICNPYDWMPGYGESGVDYYSKGIDLILEVRYDKETENEKEYTLAKREFLFVHASYVMRALLPGHNIIYAGKYDESYNAGTLVEFERSKWAEDCIVAYKKVSPQGYSPKFRHFSIAFLSENIVFNILAEDVVLSEEIAI